MRLIICCFFLWSFLPLQAQVKYSVSNSAAIKKYENAARLLEQNDFYQSKAELIEALEKESKFIEAYLLLGDIYRITYDFKQAKENYLKAYLLDPQFAPERTFYLAECELKTGDYVNCKKHLQIFLTLEEIKQEKKELANKYLKDCDFAIYSIQHPVKFEPVNMGAAINSAEHEYMASLTTDEQTIIFTRQIKNNEDFYQSKKSNDQWQEAKYLSPNINTPSYNEGAQCISPDGQFLFFTGCNRPDGFGRCDIYVSQREGDGWSKPVNLGYPVNTNGWESQPSLSADGQTLYFVSDRKGGYGSYDIWKSTLTPEGKWGVPVNLGPNINTKYGEQSPFIHQDNETFYFSSDGWTGLGNKDLFISRLDSAGNWGVAENLGYPINTYGEERGLTINASGTKAYFSSDNFNGFGGFDIYYFNLPAQLKPKWTNYIKGKVYASKSGKPLNALVEILELKTSTVLYAAYANAIDGTFLATLPRQANYSLNVSHPGYLFHTENFSPDFYDLNQPVLLDIPLEKIEVGNKVILKNIFFDTNKYDLKDESLTELNILANFLIQNAKIKIEIRGYTDDIGDDKSNLVLSENRAKAVFNYLTQHFNVSAERLSFKGYGEDMPMADNATEKGRALNRRTEFVITEIKSM